MKSKELLEVAPDEFAEEYPYPIMRLDEQGRLLYANSASLPILLEWNIEVGDVVVSDMLAVARQVLSQGIAVRKDVRHGQATIELTCSPSSRGRAVNIFGRDVTAQLYLQEELVESKRIAIAARDEAQGARFFLEKAEIIGEYGSWEFNLLTGKTKWSDGLFNVLGLERGATVPSLPAFVEAVFVDDRASVLAAVKRIIEEPGQEARVEYRVVRRDENGGIRRIRGLRQAVIGGAGKPIKVIGIEQDVTSLVVAQEEARFYKAALDEAAIVAITDRAGVITNVNENFCRISKYDKGELIGKTHRVVNSGVMPSDFFRTMWKTIGAGRAWKGEVCNRAKDGQLYWVDTSIIPIVGANGRPDRYVAIRTDISKRKEAEEELIRAKEEATKAYQRLEEAEKVGQFGSWVWNLAENSFRCSKGLFSAFHWSDDLVPTYATFMACLVPEDRKMFAPAMEASIVTGEPFSCSYRIRLGDGQIRWLRNEGHPVRNESGRVVELVGTVQDVTEKVQRESELTEAMLRADAATRAKAEFLANMSHEIRTPMNGVIGMCDLLLGSVSDSQQKERLQIIQSCGNTLLSIINDILDFSKLEAGKIEVEAEPFDLHLAAQDVMHLLSAKAVEKGLLLSYRPEPLTPAWVRGDTTRFRQVLTNLVSNAIKFTEKGTVSIVSRARALDGGLHEIQFSVSDTGVGISENAKGKMFGSFSQADVSTTRKYGGTGLGLAISKGLCEKMGGRIWYESEEGKGSTFHFTMALPLADPLRGSSESGNGVDPVSDLGTKNPLKVLLAEDNRVNQLVAIGFLEKLGFRPDVAANGLEVIESLERCRYDVIFMDLHMPELDGVETSKVISEKYPEGQRPYIIALTASAMEADIDRCKAAGMKDFIGKPVRLEDFHRALSEFIGGAPSQSMRQGGAPTPDHSVIDADTLTTNFAGLEDVLSEAIESFLSLRASLMENLRGAIERREAKSVHIAAHTLKGAVSTFFAEPARLLALKLEKMGEAGDLSGADAPFRDLSLEVERLCEALEKFKKDRKAA